MEELDNCPKCGASFIGDPIPEDIIESYSGTHWRREIAIDGGMMGIYDGVVAYRCVDCGYYFPRNTSKWAIELFNKFKNKIGESNDNNDGN